MKSFEYADGHITERELMVAVASVLIGLGILMLPRIIAQQTNAADGLISIAIGGGIIVFVTWVMAKLSSAFPGKSLIDYATMIVGKPIAVGIVCLFSVIVLLTLSQILRVTADVTKEYLFDKTPVEMLALLFLLVLVYAVSSSRIGLFRLNVLFFPIIIVIVLIVTGFSLPEIELGNLQPVMTSDASSYIQALKGSVLAFSGSSIVLFYTALVKQPKRVPKAAAIGTVIPVVLYMALFIIVIGVFNNSVTTNLMYPTIELAKNTQIPGNLFERFESVFFVIWSMAIFNTGTMFLDVIVLALTSVFQKVKKIHVIFIVTPLIYFIAMVPGTLYTVERFGEIMGIILFIYVVSITLILIITAKIRGVI